MVFTINLKASLPLCSSCKPSYSIMGDLPFRPLPISSKSPRFRIRPSMYATNNNVLTTALEGVMQDGGEIFSKLQRVATTGLMVYSAVRPMVNLFLGQYLSEHTIKIDEFDGLDKNLLFVAVQRHVTTRVKSSPSISSPRCKKASKVDDSDKSPINVTMDKGEAIMDEFKGVKFKWVLSAEQVKSKQKENQQSIVLSFLLKFHQKHEGMVVVEYLPFILKEAESAKPQAREVRLHTVNQYCWHGDPWASTQYEHPSTFDNLAMDPEKKRMLIEDLELFLSRGEFYRRVGKVWKRGYLLYGPSGTSSLIAAIANYLKFDVYDLHLRAVDSDWELQQLLLTMPNKSILVVEDIDRCNIQLIDQKSSPNKDKDEKDKITLPGLLNSIDGLWSMRNRTNNHIHNK